MYSPMPGVPENITQLRRRHQQLEANIAHYEARVSEQTKELQAMNRSSSRTGYSDDGGEEEPKDGDETIPLTKEDLEREEEEIKELERKKKGLEERVTGMEKDLSGLGR